MKPELRYYRTNQTWQSPDHAVCNYERQLLDEIEMLRLELDELNHKLATILNRADL